jgi:hypothetical protein
MKDIYHQFTYSLLLFLLLIVSCNSSKKSGESSANETTEEAVVEVSKEAEVESDDSSEPQSNKTGSLKNNTTNIPTRLSGVYVTSIKMPHINHQYNHLFDNDESTYWASMPGAGPDEGIMMYFEEAVDISTLFINQMQGQAYANIKHISLYVNGSPEGNKKVSPDGIIIDQNEVSSLYIRFYLLDHNETKTDPNYLMHEIFNPKKSVAISQIVLHSNEKRLQLIPPKIVAGKLTASSTLTPKEAYGIHNLMDSRKEFAWVEGAAGLGIGETITAEFDSPQKIIGIKINNGFQRSDKHFQANARLQTAVFRDEKGNENKVEVKDVMGVQRIEFAQPLEGKKISITIEKGYKGTAYEDLVISEMKFFNNDYDIIVADKTVETMKKDLQHKSNSTVLSQILDRRILNKQEDMEGFTNSFILRSDYTFVAYLKSWDESGEVEQQSEKIADGNWEIREISPDKVKIRVFGKLANVSTTFDYYAGNSKDSYLQIFQDFVTIEKDKLSGEKFIDEFKIFLND